MVTYGTAMAGTVGFAAPFDVAAVDPAGEERELMARLARGDASALGVLYDRHAAQALGLARRILGDVGQAEEVVQDAFVAAWRRAATFDAARGGARSWLLGIVHHRAIDRLRAVRSGGAAATGLDPSLGGDEAADVWREVAARLDRRRIVEALRTLPPVQREAVELAFFHGLTHVEIAERLDLPLGTIKGRVRLGLTKLRRLLEEGLAR
jgi:RNA polymerase sigma-70 factor (ECF subfamily)